MTGHPAVQASDLYAALRGLACLIRHDRSTMSAHHPPRLLDSPTENCLIFRPNTIRIVTTSGFAELARCDLLTEEPAQGALKVVTTGAEPLIALLDQCEQAVAEHPSSTVEFQAEETLYAVLLHPSRGELARVQLQSAGKNVQHKTTDAPRWTMPEIDMFTLLAAPPTISVSVSNYAPEPARGLSGDLLLAAYSDLRKSLFLTDRYSMLRFNGAEVKVQAPKHSPHHADEDGNVGVVTVSAFALMVAAGLGLQDFAYGITSSITLIKHPTSHVVFAAPNVIDVPAVGLPHIWETATGEHNPNSVNLTKATAMNTYSTEEIASARCAGANKDLAVLNVENPPGYTATFDRKRFLPVMERMGDAKAVAFLNSRESRCWLLARGMCNEQTVEMIGMGANG